MSKQLDLFPQQSLPSWWTEADSEICRDHNAQDARTDSPANKSAKALEAWLDSLHPRIDEYRCRNCIGFQSHDGIEGFCLRRYAQARREYEDEEPNQDEEFFEPYEPGTREFCVAAKDLCEEYSPRVRD